MQTVSPIAPLIINEPCLSHNVGAVFSSSGAIVPQYQFLVGSPLGDTVAKSSTMKSLVNFTGSAHEAEVADYFLNNPFTNDASFGPWSLVNSKSAVVGGSDCKNADTVGHVSTEFLQLVQGSIDFDLFFAMGSVDLSGTVYLHFSRNAGGIPVPDSYTLAGGTLVYDLYDFDYDTAAPAPFAAKVQAGFGTLGNGGRVYKILVYLDSSLPILI